MNDLPILALAPMAGITDWPMRTLSLEQGCNYTTTEMISAMGYLTVPDSFKIYRDLLTVSPQERKPVVQIFGRDPGNLSEAAKRLSDSGSFSGIDINMGCPAQKVVSGGNGSALMKDLPLCAQIIAAVRRATALPLSVKMRLGWDEAHLCAPELARIAEDNGVDLLTVHGRTRVQQYAGKADWQRISEVKQGVHIPVLANGDINSAESARSALQITGCDGIAIGRGALGNPFVFAEIKTALKGGAYTPPSLSDIVDTAIRHCETMRLWKGEHSAVLEMRKHLCWYIHGLRGAAQFRTRITHAESMNEVYDLLRAFQHSKAAESEAP